MPKSEKALYPPEAERILALGERLRLARLRRRIPLIDMASRIGVSRTTLIALERGKASVSLAVLVRALSVLGLIDDLDVVARDDALGRRLQDIRLPAARRSRRVKRADG
jgi:transcriptional regulator with XRE-family HTH domain